MARRNGNQAEKEEESKKGLIILIVILCVVIVALLVVIAFLLGRGNQAGNVTTAENGNTRQVAGSVRTVVDEASARSVMDEMREEVAEGMFKCDMTMTWNFDEGGAKPRDAYVANNADNTHPIFFDVYLEGTDELLYSSPVLEVGNTWTDIALSEKLDPGTYKADVKYTLLKDSQSQEEISSAIFVITINVLN